MLIAIVCMILGVVLLVAGGEVLLRGAVGLATALRLTPAVIGMTVVAAGTSFPELAVSATAAYRGSPDLAVGNVVGSNIFNITVILGLAALIRTLPISGVTLKLEYPVLMIVTGLAILACRDGRVDAVEGVVFLAVYAVFMGVSVVLARRLNPAVAAEFQEEVAAMSLPGDQPRLMFTVLLLAAGLLLLSAGAQSTVYGATVLALQLGMSERVVGLTIVAIGTGLPEVVASVISAARGRGDVAIGNAIGSNMFNLLVVLGATSLFRPVPVAPETAASDLWWMLGTTVIIFPLMVTRHKVGRWEGVLLLIIYVSYMVTTLNSN